MSKSWYESNVSPFGGKQQEIAAVDAGEIERLYVKKCGVSVLRYLDSVERLTLNECAITGYRYWLPLNVVGPEGLYRELSSAWGSYYQTDRWEYAKVRRLLRGKKSVVEVGCGKGYFLKSIEAVVHSAVGFELNSQAVEEKVTRFPVRRELFRAFPRGKKVEAICAFHVLEHLRDPASFIKDCLDSLVPGGALIVSTPNYEAPQFRQMADAFDLPPHHVGHFSESIYRRIALMYGCSIDYLAYSPGGSSRIDDLVQRFAETSYGYLVRKKFAKYYASRYSSRPGILVALRV